MLDALAAAGAATGLTVAAVPAARGLVAPAAIAASLLSLAVSGAALVGGGRTSGWLPVLESLALIALVFLALRRAPPPWGPAAAALAGAAVPAIIPAQASSSDSPAVTAAGMVAWAVGPLLAAGVARYLDTLDMRRAREVADAQREQRLALARDLHDFVAHDVSEIVVQAQAAQVVGAGKPQDASTVLAQIERSGLHALAAMDRALEALRDASSADGGARPPAPSYGLGDLPELIARFEAAGLARVELAVDQRIAEGLPAELGEAAYRLVSEALTNVRRHAPGASRVRVSVAESGREGLSVSVVNDAAGVSEAPRAGDRRGGFGLSGLRHHVEALGGELDAGPQEPDGWRLQALLPYADGRRGPAC